MVLDDFSAGHEWATKHCKILPPRVLGQLDTTVAGIGGEIQLTDALDKLLKSDGLNAFETDAATFDCGNKRGFLGANVELGLQGPEIKPYLQVLIYTSDG